MAATTMGGGGRRRSGRQRRPRRQMGDINVTPLVDVMLVLLIVFMITAPLLTTGVAVDLPRAESSPMPGQDEPLSVTIAPDGKIYLQESEISIDQLAPRLIAITERNTDARIFVRGDAAANYGAIMAAVSAINQAGFKKIALLTEAPVAGGEKPPVEALEAADKS